MKLALVGPRGSGKTSVSKIISARLDFPVFHLDDMITAKAGKSIARIVEESGWDRFRDMEQQALAEAVSTDDGVIDCGGGIVERESNRKLLEKPDFVLCLWGAPQTFADRIAADPMRPPLTGAQDAVSEMKAIMKKREPLYRAVATHFFDVEGLAQEKIADKIMALL